ncbi:nucleotidyl transferase AbiEii/AbiGii toxin family protein [Candidatus Cryosericum septentrionale]|uniref:nucleotidyl transferase AbiEii/AbiGii toxin family protein n=1 Tax=Candidatus Cryosericum septentrionale TaxID=2290913 RepID=UPI001A9F36C9|nr:nucleotidyl transferase AbiEii/AbiGii toxin family protein [Candidatus Cryosericum septentrionale]
MNRGEDLQRLRQQVAFDQFVTRIQYDGVNKWILKGGHALELAIGSARATRDIDLVLNTSLARGSDNHATLQRMLQQAASRSADDWLEFQVGESMMDLDGPLYGGERFPVRSMLGGRLFVAFHVDVAVGDVLLEPLRATTGEDWFGFAGIEASPLTTTSLEQQFAEKLHAYTMPRAGTRDNSRVKDLIDMILLLETGKLEPEGAAAAVLATFSHRNSHPLPERLPDPPASWKKPYAALAASCHIDVDIDAAVERIRDYYRRVVTVIATTRPDAETR